MRRNVLFVIMVIIVSLFTAARSRAAFVVKQPASKVIATSAAATETPAAASTSATTTGEVRTHHSFFYKILSKIGILSRPARIPMIAYILLSIFWLGWLAIGINDDWTGARWLIALILYILFWLPGFIYSLIMMGHYY